MTQYCWLLILIYITLPELSFAQVNDNAVYEPFRGFKYQEVVLSKLKRVTGRAADANLTREL
ncbi:MAG: hypothetical protein AAF394_02685, partial [Planctomycetota bacterium]